MATETILFEKLCENEVVEAHQPRHSNSNTGCIKYFSLASQQPNFLIRKWLHYNFGISFFAPNHQKHLPQKFT
jgi:hypothetical protein